MEIPGAWEYGWGANPTKAEGSRGRARRSRYAVGRADRIAGDLCSFFLARSDELWRRHCWLALPRNRRAPPLDRRCAIPIERGVGADVAWLGRCKPHGAGWPATA